MTVERLPAPGKADRAEIALSLVGIALMAAAIGYGVYQWGSLRDQLERRSGELESLRGEVEDLGAEVAGIRDAPLADLINPRSVAIRDSNLDKRYNIILWIELPPGRKAEIEKVQYSFDHPSYLTKLRESSEPSNGFAVGYFGWGVLNLVEITVITKERGEFTIPFAMRDEIRVVGG